MKRFSFYHKATGLFAEYSYAASAPLLDLNTPADHAAIEGSFDHLSQRVDVERASAARAAHLDAHTKNVEALRASFRPSIPGHVFREPPVPLFLATAEHVVAYQPSAPSTDHEWNEQVRRWALTPEAAQRQEQRRAALAQIHALESGQQARAVREAVLGQAGAADRLRSLDERIAALRAQI